MKKLIYLLLFFSIPFLSDAQRWKQERLSLYAGVGNNYFLGDLGGGAKDGSHYFSVRDIDWSQTRPTFQAGIRYRILRDLSIKPTVTYARLKADDAESENIGRLSRNLHFRSDIWEVGAQLEYYIITEKQLGRYTFSSYRAINRLSAYISLGGGALYYNPKAQEIRGFGPWEELRPMQNEGIAYSTFAGYLSIGIGAKFNLTDRWAIGLDISNRYTTTDFLDDAHNEYIGIDNGFADKHFDIIYNENNEPVDIGDPAVTVYEAGKTRRGDPSYNDAYMFTMITAYFKLNSVFSMPKY